ncbi:cyclase family protein [Halorhabdus sp. CBA1104]|uniref:cyclase family protein n=1 Tax=Halorhabdus sp. CBA1104 TaxID=1380432 RepID=UPI0012B37661|nr:cyclase family protein [Halorhabdus sp. CBA1104]QGN07704.1 cyclase family protein [Halorhabdus sp. CBA1104]
MHDLTHPIETGMQTYPGDPPVSVEPVATHEEDGYRESGLSLGSHTGTHVDAPAHIVPGGRTLDEFDPQSFVRTARRVDCRDVEARGAIPADRVPKVESAVDCLVFWTGWDDHWNTDRYLDHPSLSPAAAERCADQDLAVALDTLNPDPTPSDGASDAEPEGFPAHHALLGSGLLLFENLRNLGAVDTRFELRALPLKIDGDGAPVRAVGVDRS